MKIQSTGFLGGSLSLISTNFSDGLAGSTVSTSLANLKLKAGDGDGKIIVLGELEAYPTTSPSDVRLKKDIVPLNNGLDIVNALRPVSYEYLAKGQQRHMGLIAQEVQSVLPAIVADLSRNAEDGTALKGIKYQELIPVLINAIQELEDTVKQQGALIEELQLERK